jgi:hypothetical protein
MLGEFLVTKHMISAAICYGPELLTEKLEYHCPKQFPAL